ncbi:MAG TPA: inorganic phosphate transporter [Candidatus Thermoplasmatota archaeon]|nr:inorganic phosphate transporter [Candidatus Thermoplasmatota archaeon]
MLEGILGFITAHPFISAAILVALIFDFVNGFHDAANAIATIVATKVLNPGQALLLAGVMNFLGPFLLGTAVAATIGKGIIQTGGIDPAFLPSIIFGALMGAIIWNLITWYVGLPSSSSHALVGGLVGAALAAVGPAGIVMPKWSEMLGIGETLLVGAGVGLLGGLAAFGASRIRLPRPVMLVLALLGAAGMGVLYFNTHALPDWTDWQEVLQYVLIMLTMLFLGAIGGTVLWVATQQRMSLRLVPGFALFGACVALVVAVLMETLKLGGITKTVLFMVVSPILGFFAGFLLSSSVSWFALRRDPSKVASGSKKAQIFSASFYALMHGTNDAQKTMGIMAVLLIAAGALTADPAAKELDIPTWVFLSAASAMGLGTLFGGWRIIKTMASKITHLTPIQGFAAETGGGVVLVGMAQAGIPVSTTHAITASMLGVTV